MNIILGIISIILTFGTVVLLEKIFKKEGLLIWISIATILANIIVCKTINIFGITSSLGNIMFASNFLATDIITEKYGSDYAKKAINCALVATIIFIVTTQISLLFIPDVTDIAQESMKTLFSLNLRTSLASLTLFYLSNKFDIYLYEKLKNKYPNKLWLRNNTATIISNCLENYLFALLAFIGIFNIPTIISIATTGSIIEIVIAILDTPYIYISKLLK
ncbi:MAG: queuosine precursor transporter [Bacilli bacterium]|nr:queuosine precursor transporter [Bacilli bacterium]